MKNFIIYDAIGTILRTGSCPDEMVSMQALPGETAMVGAARDDLQYISGGLVTDKPTIPSAIDKTTIFANATENATISGLPNPTHAVVSGMGTNQNLDVTDGVLALNFDFTGVYKVRLTALNKLPMEYSINAV